MIMYWAPDQLTSRPLSNLQMPCNMSVDNKGSLQMVFCRPRMVSKKLNTRFWSLEFLQILLRFMLMMLWWYDDDDDNLTLCLFTSGGGLFVVLKQTALSASVPTPTYIWSWWWWWWWWLWWWWLKKKEEEEGKMCGFWGFLLTRREERAVAALKIWQSG